HNLEPSDAVEANVRKRAERLERYCDDIVSCKVTIEAPHKHHHQGNIYSVTIDVRTPGDESIASRTADQHHAHEDVYVVIRDAFDAMRRQLQDRQRKKRGHVKFHDTPPHGKVTELYPAGDYGTITDGDGREIYFHRNSVVDDKFDDLEEGGQVRFSATQGEKGLQATTVHAAA
ncbi:MAG: HPF/RaiA family ribosome-associated protein, partial [Alphaproteobacteria bacterium]|nr:HPF/RaiA family ribosome-associated protein [Alphaproteobacteria bacterium]